MRIAVLSDIHEGLNRKNTKSDIMEPLKKWITVHSPEVFVCSGDMTAGPEKSLSLLNQLQSEFPHTRILFVHGNHDIYHKDSELAYQTLLNFEGNLGNGPVELDEKWVIIGDGGWYDYTLGMEGYTKEQFQTGTYNAFTWPDKTYAHWSEHDYDVTQRYISRIEEWLRNYQGRNIILVTHFVPFSQFVLCKNDPSWDYFNAMMGSIRFGKLAQKYGIKKYIFGHVHTRYHVVYKEIEIICNPLGYYPHEWNFKSADEEIFSCVKVINI